MKKQNLKKMAKAITLGLLLSAGLGYSTGVSASVNKIVVERNISLGTPVTLYKVDAEVTDYESMTRNTGWGHVDGGTYYYRIGDNKVEVRLAATTGNVSSWEEIGELVNTYQIDGDYQKINGVWFSTKDGYLSDNEEPLETALCEVAGEYKTYDRTNKNFNNASLPAAGEFVVKDGAKWIVNEQGKLQFVATPGVYADGGSEVTGQQFGWDVAPTYISVDAKGYGNAAGVAANAESKVWLDNVNGIYVHAKQDMAYGVLATEGSTIAKGVTAADPITLLPGKVKTIVVNADNSRAVGIGAEVNSRVSLNGMKKIRVNANGDYAVGVYAGEGSDVAVDMAKFNYNTIVVNNANSTGDSYGVDAETGSSINLKNVSRISATALKDAYGVYGSDADTKVTVTMQNGFITAGQLVYTDTDPKEVDLEKSAESAYGVSGENGAQVSVTGVRGIQAFGTDGYFGGIQAKDANTVVTLDMEKDWFNKSYIYVEANGKEGGVGSPYGVYVSNGAVVSIDKIDTIMVKSDIYGDVAKGLYIRDNDSIAGRGQIVGLFNEETGEYGAAQVAHIYVEAEQNLAHGVFVQRDYYVENDEKKAKIALTGVNSIEAYGISGDGIQLDYCDATVDMVSEGFKQATIRVVHHGGKDGSAHGLNANSSTLTVNNVNSIYVKTDASDFGTGGTGAEAITAMSSTVTIDMANNHFAKSLIYAEGGKTSAATIGVKADKGVNFEAVVSLKNVDSLVVLGAKEAYGIKTSGGKVVGDIIPADGDADLTYKAADIAHIYVKADSHVAVGVQATVSFGVGAEVKLNNLAGLNVISNLQPQTVAEEALSGVELPYEEFKADYVYKDNYYFRIVGDTVQVKKATETVNGGDGWPTIVDNFDYIPADSVEEFKLTKNYQKIGGKWFRLAKVADGYQAVKCGSLMDDAVYEIEGVTGYKQYRYSHEDFEQDVDDNKFVTAGISADASIVALTGQNGWGAMPYISVEANGIAVGYAAGVDAKNNATVSLDNFNSICVHANSDAYGIKSESGSNVMSLVTAEGQDYTYFAVKGGETATGIGVVGESGKTTSVAASVRSITTEGKNASIGVSAKDYATVLLGGFDRSSYIYAKDDAVFSDGSKVVGVAADNNSIVLIDKLVGADNDLQVLVDDGKGGFKFVPARAEAIKVDAFHGTGTGISVNNSSVFAGGVDFTTGEYISSNIADIGVAAKGEAKGVEVKGLAQVFLTSVESISAKSAESSAYAIYNDNGTVNVTFNGSVLKAQVDGGSGDAVAIYGKNSVTNINDTDGALSIHSFNYGTGDSVGVKAKDNSTVNVEQIGTAVIAAKQGKATLVNARKNSTVTMNGVEDGATVAVAGYEGQTIAKGRGEATINLSDMIIGLYDVDSTTTQGDPKKPAVNGTLLKVGKKGNVTLNLTNVKVDEGVANLDLGKKSEAAVNLIGSFFNGAIKRGRHAKVDMTLDKDSTWGVTGDSNVRTLNNAGTVDMTADGNAFSTLKVRNLKQTIGDTANFVMDVNMDPTAATQYDQVVVNGVEMDPGSTISLNVKPNVLNFTDNDDVLAKLNSENAPVFFALDSGLDSASFDVTVNGDKYFDLGAIRTNVAAGVDADGNGYLTLVPATKNGKQALSAKGNAALSAVIDPETWYLDTEALNDNMDEYNSARPKQQVWAKYTNKKNVYDDSFDGKAVNNGDVDKKYNGIVLGWDNRVKTYEKSGAALYVGAMLTYGDGKYSWSGGSNEIDGKGIGLYGIYKTDKGAYVSAVMKYNKYTLDEIKGAQRGVIDGGFNDEYDSNAFGISLNAGRRYAKDLSNGFYYEPQVELGFVKYGNDNYDLDGMKVNVESMNSFRGRIGIQAGTHKVTGKGNFHDIYAKFSLNNEFSGTNDVRMGAYTFESDQGGAWANFAIGGRVGNMDKFNADLSLNMSRGSHDSKAGFKVGFNWMF